ncbi:MAG: hypothetical protein CSA49_05825, partial [Gammaproteobacteria bacterium]
KRRGMSFVGSTIMYAYLQSIGVVNDHQKNCFCRSGSDSRPIWRESCWKTA